MSPEFKAKEEEVATARKAAEKERGDFMATAPI
jgi:hypothetical protein